MPGHWRGLHNRQFFYLFQNFGQFILCPKNGWTLVFSFLVIIGSNIFTSQQYYAVWYFCTVQIIIHVNHFDRNRFRVPSDWIDSIILMKSFNIYMLYVYKTVAYVRNRLWLHNLRIPFFHSVKNCFGIRRACVPAACKRRGMNWS